MSPKFRKLDIELPRQPLADQRPWQLAGLLLVLLLLVFALLSYVNYQKESAPVHPVQGNNTVRYNSK